jgi:hypothetical protein
MTPPAAMKTQAVASKSGLTDRGCRRGAFRVCSRIPFITSMIMGMDFSVMASTISSRACPANRFHTSIAGILGFSSTIRFSRQVASRSVFIACLLVTPVRTSEAPAQS